MTFAQRAALAVAVTFALSLALRWHAIAYTGFFNPDEAEILAAGRRAAMQVWLPMETSSANTYLVLWPTSLGSLDALGLPLTLRVAHLLSACSYAALISMVWVATARRWGWIWPAIFILPPAYWMLVVHADFMALGTEVPSVLVLALGAVVAFRPDPAVSAGRLAVVAAIASLAPWFKPQSGPLAVALVISACGFAYLSREGAWSRGEWIRRGALLTAGGLGPTVLLVAVMIVGGTIDLFWDEPVGFLRAYLTHKVGGLGGLGGTTAPLADKVNALLPYLWANGVAFGWALMGLRGLRLSGRRSAARAAACVAIWALPIVAALATLMVLYPVYIHYLNLLYAGTAMSAIAGAGLAGLPDAKESPEPPLPAMRDRTMAATAVALSMFALLVLRGPQVFGAPTHQDERTLSALCPRGASVFVWGWAAELYSYYDWQPASRYVTFGLLLAETPNRDHYRSRFLHEMADAPPACVVNAVGPAWFGGTTVDMQMENEIPASRDWLERCYVLETVTLTAGDPVNVWSRKPDC